MNLTQNPRCNDFGTRGRMINQCREIHFPSLSDEQLYHILDIAGMSPAPITKQEVAEAIAGLGRYLNAAGVNLDVDAADDFRSIKSESYDHADAAFATWPDATGSDLELLNTEKDEEK